MTQRSRFVVVLTTAILLIPGCMDDPAATDGDADLTTCEIPDALDGTTSGVYWIRESSQDGRARILIDGIENENSATLLLQKRPTGMPPGEQLAEVEPLGQYTYIHLPDGPAMFAAGDDATLRNTPNERRSNGQHVAEIPDGQELGITLLLAGSSVQAEVVLKGSTVVSCYPYETQDHNRVPLVNQSDGTWSREETRPIDGDAYLMTHCIVRGGETDPVAGESVRISAQADGGQQFGSSYIFSDLRARDQPIPYGVCFHMQGIAETLQSVATFQATLFEGDVARSFWMMATAPPKPFA